MRERHGEPEQGAPDRLIGAPKLQNCRSGVESTDLPTVNTRFVDVTSGPSNDQLRGTYFCAEK